MMKICLIQKPFQAIGGPSATRDPGESGNNMVYFGANHRKPTGDEVEITIRTGPKVKHAKLDRVLMQLGKLERGLYGHVSRLTKVNGRSLEANFQKAEKASWTRKMGRELRLLYGLMLRGLSSEDNTLDIYVHVRPSLKNPVDVLRQAGMEAVAGTRLQEPDVLQLRGKVKFTDLQKVGRLRGVLGMFLEQRVPNPLDKAQQA